MNQHATAIKEEYLYKFETALKQYMALESRHPYETLTRYKDMLYRVAFLAEIWICIEAQQKEKNNGRI